MNEFDLLIWDDMTTEDENKLLRLARAIIERIEKDQIQQRLPYATTVELIASDNGDNWWGYPLAVLIEDRHCFLEGYALCDALEGDVEDQVHFVMEQLEETLGANLAPVIKG